jgi:hypothetical protein
MFLTVEEVLAAGSRAIERSPEDQQRMLANYMPQDAYSGMLRSYASYRRSEGVPPEDIIDQATGFAIGFAVGWELAMKACRK